MRPRLGTISAVFEEEIDRIASYGIRGLPVLVEALPLLLLHDHLRDTGDAVKVLREMRDNKLAA